MGNKTNSYLKHISDGLSATEKNEARKRSRARPKRVLGHVKRGQRPTRAGNEQSGGKQRAPGRNLPDS